MRKVNNIHEKRRLSLTKKETESSLKVSGESVEKGSELVNVVKDVARIEPFNTLSFPYIIFLILVATGIALFKVNSKQVAQENAKIESRQKDLLSDTSYNKSVKIGVDGETSYEDSVKTVEELEKNKGLTSSENSKKSKSLPSPFASIITLGLGLFAFWKWFDFFASFNPGNAFTSILSPGVITFLTFRWQDIWVWFNV